MLISKTFKVEENISRLNEFLDLIKKFSGQVDGTIIRNVEELTTYLVGVVTVQSFEHNMVFTSVRAKNKYFSNEKTKTPVKELFENDYKKDAMPVFIPYMMIGILDIDYHYVSFYTDINSEKEDYNKLEIIYANIEYILTCLIMLDKLINHYIRLIKLSNYSIDLAKFENRLDLKSQIQEKHSQLNSLALLIDNKNIVDRARVINLCNRFLYIRNISNQTAISSSIDDYISNSVSYKIKQEIIGEIKKSYMSAMRGNNHEIDL